jgi:hypothetical protein
MERTDKVNRVVVELDGTTNQFLLNPKTFSTGSRGYHAQGKIEVPNGKRYQVNLLFTEIGSKPKKTE